MPELGETTPIFESPQEVFSAELTSRTDMPKIPEELIPEDLATTIVTPPQSLELPRSAEPPRYRFSTVRKVAAVALAAAAAILPATQATGHHVAAAKPKPAHAKLYIPAQHPYPASHNSNTFQPIPTAAYVDAERILAMPDQRIQDKLQQKYEQVVAQRTSVVAANSARLFSGPRITPRQIKKLSFEAQQVAAKEAGVTVVSPLSAYDMLTNKNGSQLKPSLTVNTAFTATQNYLSQFGIALRWADKTDDLDWKLQTVTDKNSDREVVLADLENLVQGTSQLTHEYIDHIDGNKGLTFTLAANPEAKVAAYAETSGDHNKVVFNVGADISPDIEQHELYHLQDAAEAGGPNAAANDPTYISDNGGQNTYTYDFTEKGTKQNPQYDTDTFDKSLEKASKLLEDEFRARQRGDMITSCAIRAQYDTKLTQAGNEVTVTSSYATTFPVEDKAELGKNINRSGSSEWDSLLSPTTPYLREKFLELFAREVYFDPKDAVYNTLLTYHAQPNTYESPVACDAPVTYDNSHGK